MSAALDPSSHHPSPEPHGEQPPFLPPVIEEVALTVPASDTPSLPVLTFRVWILGLASCISLAFVNEFFQFRSEPMKITALSATLAALPLGHALAFALPTSTFRLWRFCFSLNPGPFNVKEHVLITIFANAGNAFGYGGAFAIEMVNVIKVFYHLRITFLVGLSLVLCSQLIGYGWAGLMRKQLIDPAYMWWPSTLVQVSLFRTLHEKEEDDSISYSDGGECKKKQTKKKGRKWRTAMATRRSQVFFTVTAASFAYYLLPGYLAPWLTCISVLCLAWPRSMVAQQLGSGIRGLGIGAFTLDWAAVSSFLGSPLVFPSSVIFNMIAGTVAVVYFITPLLYYSVQSYHAPNFPIISAGLFTQSGNIYNVSSALSNPRDPTSVEGDLYLSTFFAVSLALLFAAPAASVTHFLLFHGRDTLRYLLSEESSGEKVDVHTGLMRRYDDIPRRWFVVLLVVCVAVVAAVCVLFEAQVQIPWWGALLACAIAAVVTLPIGIIAATTNMTPALMVPMQFLGGYLFPGNPIANQGMKLFGHMSMQQAIFFLQDFKLGHYMKIPPRTMFLVQFVGTVVAGVMNLATAWWLYGSVPHLCNVDGKLSAGSPWTCPWDVVAYDTTIVWGVIGPNKTLGSDGPYKNLAYWALGVGAVGAPLAVWSLSKCFPKLAPWLKLVNVPVILGATGWMPAAGTINYTSWFAVGILFNVYIFRHHKMWWKRYNYILSAGLDAGTAIMGILLSLTLGLRGIQVDWWGSQKYSDHCPLSACPLNATISAAPPNCPLYG